VVDSMRERAQWTGDTLTVGLELAAAGWSDLSLFRQALVQAAECANREGMVAGCGPGDVIYLSTYAAYWLAAAPRYVELTGDHALLHELLPAARANLAALRRRMRPDGVLEGAPWPFVDWGHTPMTGGLDVAVAAIVLAGARALSRWETLVGAAPSGAEAFAAQLTGLLENRLAGLTDPDSWRRLGYHATVWALRCDLVAPVQRPAALAGVREHMRRCFPNHLGAPRLRNPGVRDEQLITPFFGHFALDVLLQAGDVDFVIEQWRSCWGWMLAQGATTWWEVFDEGWSHCHFWSGCPTWQMSRYLLGLQLRWDRGEGEVELELHPGSLEWASGTLPLPGGQADVSWRRRGGSIAWEVRATTALTLTNRGERHRVMPGQRLELELPAG
jgi:alpha-L-rhamnosidase